MKKRKFLIVEDEPLIALHLEETLSGFGYSNIFKAHDAPIALEYLKKNRFDMVLMDINLGGGENGKDGIDVVNEVKKQYDIPVMYITGNSDDKTVTKAKQSKPDGFITKPFNANELKINIDILLYKSQQRLNMQEPIFSFEEENVSEKNPKNLVIRLGKDGEILYVNSAIKKITNMPPLFYSHKNIDNSDLDPFFAATLSNIINEVKSANRYLFYCNVRNREKGERIMEIIVTPGNIVNNSFDSYMLNFNDITDRVGGDDNNWGISIKRKEYNFNNKKAVATFNLTSRELDVLVCVKDGLSNKMIGESLNISHKTVSIHRTNIMKKLKAKNAAELVKIAIENNLIPRKKKNISRS